jgi:hypothetical protein
MKSVRKMKFTMSEKAACNVAGEPFSNELPAFS